MMSNGLILNIPLNPSHSQLEEYVLNNKVTATPKYTLEEALLDQFNKSKLVYSINNFKPFHSVLEKFNIDEKPTIGYSFSGIETSLHYQDGDLEQIKLFKTESIPKNRDMDNLFPNGIDEFYNFGLVVVHGILTISKGQETNILQAIIEEDYSKLNFIVDTIELEESIESDNLEFLIKSLPDCFKTSMDFDIEDSSDLEKDKVGELIKSLLNNSQEIEEELNAYISGVYLKSGSIKTFFKKESDHYPLFNGVVENIIWEAYGDKLLPIALVKNREGDEIKVPLYSPKTLLIADINIGKEMYFSFGEFIGHVPLTRDGQLAVTLLDFI